MFLIILTVENSQLFRLGTYFVTRTGEIKKKIGMELFISVLEGK